MLSYGLGHDQHLHVRRSNLFQGPYNKRIDYTLSVTVPFELLTLSFRLTHLHHVDYFKPSP